MASGEELPWPETPLVGFKLLSVPQKANTYDKHDGPVVTITAAAKLLIKVLTKTRGYIRTP